MPHLSRRTFIRATAGGLAGGSLMLAAGAARLNFGAKPMLTIYTFGDSILDCAHYNQYGVTPGGLLVRNNDRLFPEFRGNDLSSRGPVRLEHRAVDGASVGGLPGQARGLRVEGPSAALITIGGNDLLTGLVVDSGPGIRAFAERLETFVKELPVERKLLGNVYDPSFGNDENNFLEIDPALARANHRRVNAAIAGVAARYGQLVDLHEHFLTGRPDWLTRTIEPSHLGASEIRRCFLRYF